MIVNFCGNLIDTQWIYNIGKVEGWEGEYGECSYGKCIDHVQNPYFHINFVITIKHPNFNGYYNSSCLYGKEMETYIKSFEELVILRNELVEIWKGDKERYPTIDFKPLNKMELDELERQSKIPVHGDD